jgi:excisionase family DNA binding protein
VSDLSPKQAAVELGVSRSLVYRLVEKGEFPGAYHVSNRLRIPRADLDALRERRRVRPRQSAPIYEPSASSRARHESSSFASQLRAIRGGAA